MRGDDYAPGLVVPRSFSPVTVEILRRAFVNDGATAAEQRARAYDVTYHELIDIVCKTMDRRGRVRR